MEGESDDQKEIVADSDDDEGDEEGDMKGNAFPFFSTGIAALGAPLVYWLIVILQTYKQDSSDNFNSFESRKGYVSIELLILALSRAGVDEIRENEEVKLETGP
ncbi:hypothetical protein L2E82_25779 [Cichorium intybus]|uniref:Uncharacterized protein n=1 Tax=Cichorium intybus TaxID=13427 RepID=A0ACB9E519_CICIN|nr:hypothetical protein L2E82_25779 [Cichorium intybus]